MSMNLSLQRLSTSSNAQHAYQFDCTFTSRKCGIPLQNAKTRFIHMWKFACFSPPFHEFLTVFSHFWVLRCLCIFVTICRNREEKIFRSPMTISDQANTGQLTAAILQTGGTLTSSRQHFFLLVPHQM